MKRNTEGEIMKSAGRSWVVSLVAGVLMSGMVSFGQEENAGMPPPGAAPMPPPGPGATVPGGDTGMRGRWAERMRGGEIGDEGMIERLLKKSELTTQIGLTDEQIAALKKAVDDLKKQQKDLRVEQEKAGLEQARLMLETNVNEQAVMAAVEKAGKASTDLAKLRVKQLLLLRNTLTAEQIDKVKELMRQRVQKMQEERQKGDRGPRGQDMNKERKRKDRDQGTEGAGATPPTVPPPAPDGN